MRTPQTITGPWSAKRSAGSITITATGRSGLPTKVQNIAEIRPGPNGVEAVDGAGNIYILAV